MTKPRVAMVPLARPGGSLALVKARRRAALAVLDRLDVELAGPRGLLLDAAGMMRAARSLAAFQPEQLVFLQLTFTLPSPTVRLARAVGAPALLWGFPGMEEGSTSNSLRGVEAAAQAMAALAMPCRILRLDPDDPRAAAILGDMLLSPAEAAAS